MTDEFIVHRIRKISEERDNLVAFVEEKGLCKIYREWKKKREDD